MRTSVRPFSGAVPERLSGAERPIVCTGGPQTLLPILRQVTLGRTLELTRRAR